MQRDLMILDAAEKLFYEHGYDGIGVDAIGRAAGVSGSAIYRHFSGKEEILGTLFDHAIDVLLINAGEPRPDAHADLEHLVDVHLAFSLEHPRLAVIWAHEQRKLLGSSDGRYLRRQRQYLGRWLDCLERADPTRNQDDLKIVLYGVLALLMSSDSRRPGPTASTAHTHAILREMALSSLGVRALAG